MNTINLNLIRKNPLTIPVIMADKLDIFKKYDININLKISEDFVFDGNSDFYEGRADAMVGDITFFFYMLERGKKAVLTSNLTRTIHVVGGKNYPKDLKNLKVGVNRAGLFRLYLENDLKDLMPGAKPVWINNSYERLKALEDGEIDALVAIEPFVTDVIEKGGEVIWSSKDSEKNLVMWAFDQTFCMNNKKLVSDFHKALEGAQNLFNEASPEEKIKIGVDIVGYNIEMAKRLKDFTFERQALFRHEDFNLCQEWMYREQEISKIYNSEELICDILTN
ncbi:ABC transporter substrate-binding protein [Romboutsia weinsteinii]|uniref:ABC transporter substrate-binding protein n=1 Tax=Romboutsia weinsteinii TaxID=2020949 RepID=A0A371IY49_9FIRM|nr:transporter substrate-binding domain-containing protein [Romboutsia weinsteinii]RDY25425.1 ABC transporter substrate-binding protein [Romboutsia weinsteinii]